jgi:hypothetical protein
MHFFKLTAPMLILSTSAVLANPAHNQIHAMTEAARQAFMANYLSANGEKCPSVVRTFFQGVSANGDAFWNVSCRGGKSFALTIRNDANGSVKMLDCAVLKAVGGGTCFVKFTR